MSDKALSTLAWFFGGFALPMFLVLPLLNSGEAYVRTLALGFAGIAVALPCAAVLVLRQWGRRE